jgi:hypothetical protein
VCRPIGEAGDPLEARGARLAANYSGMVFGFGFDLSVLSAVFSSAAPASSVTALAVECDALWRGHCC